MRFDALSQVGVAPAGLRAVTSAYTAGCLSARVLSLVLRTSFRQLLLLAFVLIAAALGAVSLSGLQALQGLMAKSREAAQQAVALNLAVSGLGDRATDMERAARQYLVLGDPALRQRYDVAVRDARSALQPLADFEPTAALARHWLGAASAIRRQLDNPGLAAPERDQALGRSFDQLGEGTRKLTVQVQRSIAERNQAVQDALEAQRARLVRQVAVAIVVVALAALAFGLWLTRPLRQLGRAIQALGQGRMAEPVEIAGPSDLASLGEQLDWLRLRLLESDADKDRFLRHTSHELKTPLAALREGTSLLQEGVGGPLSPGQAEIVGILRHNTAVLQQQIEDLLRYNAAAFDAQRLQRRPTRLRTLVEGVVEAQRLSAQARRITVTVDGGERLELPVDPERLGMALANLMINAIRFTPPGGTIGWRIWREGEQAALEIRDSGPGVPEADREHIFDPFFRGALQPEDQPRGSGIGLSIVREQVAAHGGSVTLQPGPGGATFRILLPLGTHHV
ncbi:HAMP domain-containing protein [Ideonella sp. B7]|nr:HAMP domain-containing protein [Ideonella benzenivorans]